MKRVLLALPFIFGGNAFLALNADDACMFDDQVVSTQSDDSMIMQDDGTSCDQSSAGQAMACNDDSCGDDSQSIDTTSAAAQEQDQAQGGNVPGALVVKNDDKELVIDIYLPNFNVSDLEFQLISGQDGMNYLVGMLRSAMARSTQPADSGENVDVSEIPAQGNDAADPTGFYLAIPQGFAPDGIKVEVVDGQTVRVTVARDSSASQVDDATLQASMDGDAAIDDQGNDQVSLDDQDDSQDQGDDEQEDFNSESGNEATN